MPRPTGLVVRDGPCPVAIAPADRLIVPGLTARLDAEGKFAPNPVFGGDTCPVRSPAVAKCVSFDTVSSRLQMEMTNPSLIR